VLAVTAAFLVIATASAQDRSGPASIDAPQALEIQRAIAQVKADPNLATEQTIKTLKWRTSPDPKPPRVPAWVTWIVNLIRWVEQSARVLVWCAAAVLAGMLAVYISRLVHAGRGPISDDGFVAPTHVRDLDIRPETLPSDIGGAARTLWDRGEHRAALALLYRGMLSRLAHVHRIPIRDSTTEGDCLTLTASHLSHDSHAYTSRLVRVWQRSVYGREALVPATVYALCDEFAMTLDAGVTVDSSRDGSGL
jgi:hypothetical protein